MFPESDYARNWHLQEYPLHIKIRPDHLSTMGGSPMGGLQNHPNDHDFTQRTSGEFGCLTGLRDA